MCSVFSAELAPGGLCFGFKSSLVELPSKALKVSAEVVDVAGASTNLKPPAGTRAHDQDSKRESPGEAGVEWFAAYEMDSPRVGGSRALWPGGASSLQ